MKGKSLMPKVIQSDIGHDHPNGRFIRKTDGVSKNWARGAFEREPEALDSFLETIEKGLSSQLRERYEDERENVNFMQEIKE